MSEFHGGPQGPRNPQQQFQPQHNVVGGSPLNPNRPSSQGYQQPFTPNHPSAQLHQKPPKKPNRWAPLVGAGLVGLLVGLVFGTAGSGDTASTSSTPQPTVTVAGPAGSEVTVTPPPVTVTKPAPPAKTVTAPPPQAAAAITEDGVYLVGMDIKPGTYRNGAEDGCYWERLSNTSGDFDAIIANGNGGNQVVTIKKTDKAFNTEDCGAWRKVG